MPKGDGTLKAINASVKIYYNNRNKEWLINDKFKKLITEEMGFEFLKNSEPARDGPFLLKKSEVARYFGLIDYLWSKRKGKITDTGIKYYESSDVSEKINIIIKSLNKISFNQGNSGVKGCNSIIEPPKLFLKSIHNLKYITKIEFGLLLYRIADQQKTFQNSINEILKLSSLADKLIGYIPSGTTNILQIEMKIKKNTDEIYRVLVSDKAKRINLTKINDKYFFLMLGVGFDSKIVESINTNLKKYLGKIIFAIKGFQHFLFLRNEKMSIEIDGETINADWILCSNSKYYAGPHSITKETNIFDDKVIVYIFRDLTRVKLLYYVWLILTKGDLSSAKSIIKRRLNSLRINGIKNKIIIQVDGENYGYSQSVEIKKTSKYINLLIP